MTIGFYITITITTIIRMTTAITMVTYTTTAITIPSVVVLPPVLDLARGERGLHIARYLQQYILLTLPYSLYRV